MTAISSAIRFADRSTRDDLRSFLARLLRIGEGEIRVQSRGAVLGVYGCTQAPVGILDSDPVVLVMRAFALAEPAQPDIDTVFDGRAIVDRLARLSGEDLLLHVPDVTVTAAWAGVLPPHSGWIDAGSIDAASLAVVAQQGMSRVADAVPADAGEPVVQRVRRAVWASEIAPGIPASAAFAAEGMGLLVGADRLRIARAHQWTRLSSHNGYVILRSSAGIVG